MAIAGVYVAAAALSGHLSVLARRPLLDGYVPPQPYRWVKPPPDAATKEKPNAATLTVKLSPPERGAGVYATRDQQATLVVEPGAFPGPATGSLTLTIDPLDPAKLPPASGGLVVTGNVYRFQTRTKGGALAQPSKVPAHLVLAYPLPSSAVFSRQHTVLTSPDGGAWQALRSSDSPAAQQVSADVTELGYFAVGESSVSGGKSGGKKKTHSGGAIVLIVGGAVAVAAGFGVVMTRRRVVARRRKASAPRRRSK